MSLYAQVAIAKHVSCDHLGSYLTSCSKWKRTRMSFVLVQTKWCCFDPVWGNRCVRCHCLCVSVCRHERERSQGELRENSGKCVLSWLYLHLIWVRSHLYLDLCAWDRITNRLRSYNKSHILIPGVFQWPNKQPPPLPRITIFFLISRYR